MDVFSEATKETILTNFNEIGSQDGQDAHLGALVMTATKRRRPKAENPLYEQRYQYHYKVKCGDVENVVCREAFASLHGIGTKRVRRVATCVAEGRTPKDQRGRHNNKRCISDDLRNMVDTHMRSFPFRVSHYAGHGNKRRYLSSELCITKMYTLLSQASYPGHYLLVQGGLDPKEVKCEIRLTERRLHKQTAKVFYTKLKELSQVARERDDTECICFDFKQNVPFPHLPTGDVFYCRQLWLFVFGIHSAKTGKGKMYTCPETQAKRGVNEVVSCLSHYIRNSIPETVRTLRIHGWM